MAACTLILHGYGYIGKVIRRNSIPEEYNECMVLLTGYTIMESGLIKPFARRCPRGWTQTSRSLVFDTINTTQRYVRSWLVGIYPLHIEILYYTCTFHHGTIQRVFGVHFNLHECSLASGNPLYMAPVLLFHGIALHSGSYSTSRVCMVTLTGIAALSLQI